MTLQELQDMLTVMIMAHPERAEHEILLSHDPEGNGYGAISQGVSIGFIYKTDYDNIYYENETDEEGDELKEEEYTKDNGYKPVIVIYPVR